MTTYYNGDLKRDLESIHPNEHADVLKKIGEEVGFGRAQQILQVLWADHLNHQDLGTLGALLPEPIVDSSLDAMSKLLDSKKKLNTQETETLKQLLQPLLDARS
jgi:hypothetical protein